MQQRRVRKKTKKNYWSQFVLYLLLSLIVIVIGTILFFSNALKPEDNGFNEVKSVARNKGITNFNNFMTVNQKVTYYAVGGVKDGRSVYFILNKHNHRSKLVNVNNGTTKNYILNKVWNTQKPKRVYNIGLVFKNKKAVWEVSLLNNNGRLCYDLFTFNTGKLIKSEIL